MFNQIFSIDRAVLSSLNNFLSQHSIPFLEKFFSEYLIYLLPLILIILWFVSAKSKKVALRAFLAAILAWPILANLIGHLVNRARPFESAGVKELVFHRPDYSFPSDHAAAIFAIAFSFWLSGNKKLGWFVFIIGILISIFRVAAGIHWPSDILAGVVVGLVAAYLINLFDKPLDIIYNFILKIARYLGLA